jgi:hypothetical protein
MNLSMVINQLLRDKGIGTLICRAWGIIAQGVRRGQEEWCLNHPGVTLLHIGRGDRDHGGLGSAVQIYPLRLVKMALL